MLFSALGLGKGVNYLSYKHLLKLTRARRVTPGKFFSMWTGPRSHVFLTLKPEKLYSFTLFPCFCFRLLWLWFVFLESVSVLLFNFVFFENVSCWGCLLPLWDLCFCFLVVFFRFGFPFCLMCFCFVFFSGLSSAIFVVVNVLWFFCFCRPPYIFESPLHLNPTTGEHFKTALKISSQRSNRPDKK